MLVVLLVIGILAAIALPMFLGQQDKSEDAGAKSNARNLVSQVDSCFAAQEDYGECDTEADLGHTGIPYGSNPGEARVENAAGNSFTVIAVSKAKTAGVNNTFTIERTSTGLVNHLCSGTGGGCHNGTW